MAIKHVKETLGQFQDWQFFSLLEEKKEDSNGEDKKFKDEEGKDGMAAVKKLRDNLSRFETAAGGKILKYKEFWEENQNIANEFDEEGDIYKLWDSDYVAGVLNLPDEALTDDELNAEIEMVDKEGDEEEESEGEEKEEEGEDEEEEGEDEEEEGEEEEEEGEEEEEEGEEEEEEGEEEEDLEEGNAFGNALRKAKKEGKKEFKVGGKTFPVKESDMPEGEEFPLYEMDAPKTPVNEKDEDDDDEGELPSEDVTTPEEESPEEEKEVDDQEGGFAGFEEPGGEEEEDLGDLDGDGINEPDEEEVAVEDGEAIEGDGEDMDFGGEPGTSEYFVIYDMSGKDRDEVFRSDDPKVIEDFKDFFENSWKASVRSQIQAFKEAQEEKKREAEAKAKEEIRKERKAKLDKFMKD